MSCVSVVYVGFVPVVYTISDDLGYDFMAMYAMVGMWNSAFLLVYAFFGASRIMAWSTRSVSRQRSLSDLIIALHIYVHHLLLGPSVSSQLSCVQLRLLLFLFVVPSLSNKYWVVALNIACVP